MRIVVYRAILISIFAFLIIILIFPTIQGVIIEKSFSDVKSGDKNVVVFNFEIISPTGYDFLSVDEFIDHGEIDRYQLCILYISEEYIHIFCQCYINFTK